MRSVSIVYKNGHRDSCAQLPTYNASLQPRRSMDNYYNRLIEKQQLRERNQSLKREVIQRSKMKSAYNKKTDLCNIIQSLSIASLPVHGVQHSGFGRRQQLRTQNNFIVRKKVSSSKVSLAGLNLIPLDDLYAEQQCNQSLLHAKLKCIYKGKDIDNKGVVLAISVNFIMNEHYFWDQPTVQDAALRHWKMLQNHSNIVWVCHKQESLKHLLKYSKSNGLRLDAVYVIVPRKNQKLLTVGYTPIENDFIGKSFKNSSPLSPNPETKLVVINGLLVEDLSDPHYQSFNHSIPLLKNSRSMIHYAKINFNDNGRLGTVIKILSQQSLPRPLNVTKVLKDFQKHQEKADDQDCTCDVSTFQPSENDLLGRLEVFKQETTKFLQRSMSLKLSEKINCDLGENSVQFLVGDIIRRNYKIFKQYQQFCEDYQAYNNHRRVHEQGPKQRKNRKKYSPLRYRNMAYLWIF